MFKDGQFVTNAPVVWDDQRSDGTVVVHLTKENLNTYAGLERFLVAVRDADRNVVKFLQLLQVAPASKPTMRKNLETGRVSYAMTARVLAIVEDE